LRQDSHWTAKYIPPSPPTTAKFVTPHLQGGIFHGLGFVDFEPSFRRWVGFPDWRMREPAGPTAFPHLRTGLRGDLFLATWKFPLTLKREDEFLL
jgi:hypothetical protein